MRTALVVEQTSHPRAEELIGGSIDSGVAVLSYSGWLDGGYQWSAAKRHRALGTDNSRLVLGNWDHGGAQDVSPTTPRLAADVDHGAAWADFFERHVAEREPLGDDPRVRYYTMGTGEGAERWQASDAWPPLRFERRPFHLASPGRLTGPEPPEDASVGYRANRKSRTGHRSRWNSLVGQAAPVGYGDRRAAEAHLLCFTGEPLARAVEVTGHPVVHLWLACDEPDLAVFCYLHDVAPSGRSEYVTEGMLRALHHPLVSKPPPEAPWADLTPHRSFRAGDVRHLTPGERTELVIPLLPTSYRFARGHRIRLAIGGGDADHFAVVGSGTQRLTVFAGASHPSRIELPTDR